MPGLTPAGGDVQPVLEAAAEHQVGMFEASRTDRRSFAIKPQMPPLGVGELRRAGLLLLAPWLLRVGGKIAPRQRALVAGDQVGVIPRFVPTMSGGGLLSVGHDVK